MAGNGDPVLGLGELLPTLWGTSSPESSMEVLPSRGRRSLTPKLQAMPKGHKFTNLDEAHQAITSGLVAAPRSASYSSHNPATPSLGSIESVPSSLDVLTSSSRPSDQVPTDQHMELARADHRVNGRSLTTPHTPFSAAKDDCSYSGPSPASPASPVAALPAFPIGLGRDTDSSDGSIAETLSSRAPRETGSTVENIYKQYMPSESPSAASDVKNASNAETPSSPKSPTASDPDEEGNGANYRLESWEILQPPKIRLAADVLDPGKNRHHMYFSPSSAPQIPLPELPKMELDIHQGPVETTIDQADLSFTGPSMTSVSDSQILLNEALTESQDDNESIQDDADQSDLNEAGAFSFQLQPVQEPATEENIIAHGGLPLDPTLLTTDYPNRGSYVSQYGHSNERHSSGRITSESDDDPFKYDRGSYDGFRIKREREVSVALHRIDSTGSAPHSTARFSDPAPWTNQSDIPPVPALPALPMKSLPDGAATSNNPFFNQMSLRRYRNSVTSQLCGSEKMPNQVKISVQPARNLSVVKRPPVDETPGLAARLEGLKGENVTNGLTINHGMTDGGDWETVGTEVGLFDSNRACASDSFFTGSRLIKMTGSSIADYSDDGFAPPTFSRDSFESGERILQHPMEGPTTQHLRVLKDNGRPIFIPKPRIHQVNGYLQNSIRTLTGQDSLSTATSATRSLADKFTAPFRSDSFNRKRENWRNRYNNLEPSRFEFRDSQGTTDHEKEAGRAAVWHDEGEPNGEQLDEEAAVESARNPKESRFARTNEEDHQTPAADDSFMSAPDRSFLRNDGSSFGAGSSAQFDFPLIPLKEAARREALRRESGEDMFSVSTARSRGNSSLTSSTQRTVASVPSQQVTFPPPIHQRRPMTPFAIPETTESTLRITGDRTISTGIGSSPPAPGRVVFPRSCRNPFSSVHGSDRSSETFQNPYGPPHLWPRDRRNGHPFHRPGPSDDISLRGMADLNRGSRYMFSGEDASVSWDARRRRECYYRFVCVLCVLPFFALLAYRDTANAALSWYTKGETCRLTTKQRRNVLRTAKVSGMFWLCAFIVLITVLITKSAQNKHDQE